MDAKLNLNGTRISSKFGANNGALRFTITRIFIWTAKHPRQAPGGSEAGRVQQFRGHSIGGQAVDNKRLARRILQKFLKQLFGRFLVLGYPGPEMIGK
jgi:hypothetical protein